MGESISNSVLELREEAGVTQQGLAEAVGVTRQTIIALEQGNYIPSLLLAMKISDFFRKEVEDIFSIVYED